MFPSFGPLLWPAIILVGRCQRREANNEREESSTVGAMVIIIIIVIIIEADSGDYKRVKRLLKMVVELKSKMSIDAWLLLLLLYVIDSVSDE